MTDPELHIYEFGDFRIEASKHLLLRTGKPVTLTPKVFDTLLYLVRRRGDLVEKDDLIRAIWPDTVVEENNLNQNISTLRRVLGESRGENRYIVTVPGHGYRFVAAVKQVGAGVSESVSKEPNGIRTIAGAPLQAVSRGTPRRGARTRHGRRADHTPQQ